MRQVRAHHAHVSTGQLRGYRWTAAAAAVVTGAAVALVLPSPGAAVASTHCRQPVVRDVMISQGLPSYKELARGKTALVKLFLSEASSTVCSNVTSETIAITGGRLTVQNGSLQPPVVPLDVPPAGALPEFSSYDVAPVTATPADPRFVVEGKHLTTTNPAHAATTFPVSFVAVLDYVTKNKQGAVVESGTLTVTQRPGGGALSAVVSKPVKPLRLLVVPMGDADATTPEQFPHAAATEVASGIAAISRLLPLADGIGSLTSNAGLRWQMSGGMVDLGSHTETHPTTLATTTVNYMPDGKYCGGGSSFDYVQKQLSGFRSAWNAENPGAPVDRVLGVVWRDVSKGDATGDGPGCAEGYAGMGGTVSWARVVPAGSTRQGITGSLGSLELTHGFGGSVVSVKQTADGPQPGFGYPHSFSATADATAPNRAYNVPERAFLDPSKNRSVMAYDRTPYDDYNTLYEKADWDFVLCYLTTSSPTPSQDCGSPASSGAGISAAGGSYVLGGSTNGTAEGTDSHTYFDADMPRDGTDPSSGYRLVQRNASGAVVAPSTGVLMSSTGSDHHDGGSSHTELSRLAFDVAIPQQDGAVAFELWKGEPDASGAVRLLHRAFDAQAPVIAATGTAPAPAGVLRYTSDGTSTQPAVSPDGKLVAFTTPQGVVVARSSADAPRSAPVAGEQAAWRPDGQELAAVRDGEVYLVSVTVPSTGAPVLGAPRKVYGSRVGTGTPPASRPTFSPDAAELAISVNGDLFAVNLRLLTPDAYPVLCPLDALVQDATAASSGLACRRLTATSDAETAPSWSTARGLIAYVRTGAGAEGRLWTIDPRTPTSSAQERLAAGGQSYSSPAWSSTRLLAARGDGLISVGATSFGGLSVVTSSAGDWWPSVSADGARVVFARPSGTATDLFSLGLTRRTATATVQDDNPRNLRMDLYVVCDGHADPRVVAAWPSSVDEARGEAHFDLPFDSSRGCAAGQLLYRATDGYQVTRELGEPVAGQGTPAAAIYLPKPAAVVLQYDNLAVAGAAKSASGEATDHIAWTLTGPGFSQALGTGTVLPDVVPPAGGWTPGTWVVTAVPDGDTSAATSRAFTIQADTDGDGITDSQDSQTVHSCYPADAATDAGNALADPDHDLIVSLLDPDPCTSAMNATVDFNPDTLNLVSSGTPITLTLTTSALDVRKLKLSDVVISQVAGLHANLTAYALTAKSPSVLEAKFARQDFINFFNAHGLHGYVPVVMTATRSGTTARGFDLTAPVYQPS